MRHKAIWLALIVLMNSLHAQDVWLKQGKGTFLSAEFFIPTLKENSSIGIYHFVITGAVQLSDGNRIKFDVPLLWYTRPQMDFVYPHLSYSPYYQPEVKDNGVGNISVAFEKMGKSKTMSLDIGIRFPLAAETSTAPAVGAITDYDRLEMYLPNYVTMFFQINNTADGESSYYSLHFCPTLLIPTKSSNGNDEMEVYLSCSFHGGFSIKKFCIGMGYSTKLIVTESEELKDRFVHQIGLFANYRYGNITPCFFYRIPIDKNLKAILWQTIGIGLIYEFQ